jgi:hypothetical protein
MSANRGCPSLLAGMLVTLLCTHMAQAQAPIYGDPRPLSNTGGPAGSELSQIYRQDIGSGFSGASTNRNYLRDTMVRAPYGPGGGSISTAPQGPRIGLGAGTSSPAGKPFSGYTPAPTVSPYLNLFRDDLDGSSDFNYQTLVRPMLQQQQINQQVERQAMEMARRMQSLAAQSDFNPQGSTTQFPTGHQSVFMYYGHYYPTANVRRR